jgi:hypothetical protein
MDAVVIWRRKKLFKVRQSQLQMEEMEDTFLHDT